MPVQEILGFELRRVSPFQGLMIDASIWADAHDYHRSHQRLHTLAQHGWGILAGMQVTAALKPDTSVILHPGLAVDPEGNVILVSQPHRYFIEAGEGTIYLVIQFREVPQAPTAPWDGTEERPSRLLEVYRLQERDRLPAEPYLELARIQLAGKSKPIRNAADPLRPQANEIDLRFREGADALATERVVLSHVDLGGPAEHANGLHLLARHLARQGLPRARARTHVGLSDALREPGLVYLTGQAPPDLGEEAVKQAATFLGGGGVILAEACSGAEAKGFEAGVEKLAGAVEVELTEVKSAHALLRSFHLFSAPPAGASDGGVREGGGLILSSADYGCAWSGGREKPLGRGSLRDAFEFGTNLAAYSLMRQAERAVSQTLRALGS